jgi:alpha-tubulin suppressor-like RCC1 family protein
LGIGSNNDASYLRTVSLDNVTQISARYKHSLALRNGVAYSFGRNQERQLGILSIDTRKESPQQIPGFTDIVMVSAGNSHSLILNSQGVVYGFGANTVLLIFL